MVVLQQSKQVIKNELQKFELAQMGDRNATTVRRATWDELYTAMDIEDDKKPNAE